MREERYTLTFSSISSGTSGLLIIAFKTLRYIIVYDESHIRLVYTHAKRYSSHYNIYPFHQEVVLCSRAGCRIKTGMICRSLYIVSLQYRSKLLYLFSRQAIDDTALATVLTNELHDIPIYFCCLRTYLIIKVRSVKGALEFRGIHYAKTFLYIRTDLIRRSCRQSYNRGIAYMIDDWTNPSVLRSEIMSPLRYTMCLVYGIEGYLHRLQKLHIFLLRQRLRCDIQQFGKTRTYVLFHLVYCILVQRRIEIMCHADLLAHAIDDINLILHQCYKRRDYYRRSFHNKRRQLVAQRLSASCRHQYKCIIAVQHVAYDFLLVSLKTLETKILFQLSCKINIVHHI